MDSRQDDSKGEKTLTTRIYDSGSRRTLFVYTSSAAWSILVWSSALDGNLEGVVVFFASPRKEVPQRWSDRRDLLFGMSSRLRGGVWEEQGRV